MRRFTIIGFIKHRVYVREFALDFFNLDGIIFVSGKNNILSGLKR
jgi:hypothetical protein